MKLLVEKNIFTKEQNDSLLGATGDARRALMQDYGKEIFGNDPDYSAFEQTLVDSLDQYGPDTAQNLFIAFLQKKNGVNYNLDRAKSDLLYRIFINNESAVRTPASNFWLYNPRSYDGSEFKIKALAFLGSPEAEQYGNKKNKPTQEILNTTDDSKIEALLNAWQTNDPYDPKSKTMANPDASRSGSRHHSPVNKSAVLDFLKDLVNSGADADGKLQQAIDYLSKAD